ncbi:hypothetical protein [Flavobacterium algicola]|uniref:hypothetical protein n=1 Tax=Flavobacterium algicola TaxID=556529 RepID=UPI001EFCCCFE|nr:hypothetical protein [Flavobacterium algicola]MCG9791169.1 hypothetical protein [Flavobacterium algicola]
MKRFFTVGAIALISASIFSCTADETVNNDQKARVDENSIQTDSTNTTYADYGPGDEPIHVPEPK